MKNEKKEERFHVISVPRGGEYCLKLSDGTIVYLNAESKLSYPVTFSETERKVHLVGEAFFDVQKDTTKPFKTTLPVSRMIDSLFAITLP